jgi:hypothetical protein
MLSIQRLALPQRNASKQNSLERKQSNQLLNKQKSGSQDLLFCF